MYIDMSYAHRSCLEKRQLYIGSWIKGIHEEVNHEDGPFRSDFRLALGVYMVSKSKDAIELYNHVVYHEDNWRSAGFKNVTYFIHLCEFYMGRRSVADVTKTIEAL